MWGGGAGNAVSYAYLASEISGSYPYRGPLLGPKITMMMMMVMIGGDEPDLDMCMLFIEHLPTLQHRYGTLNETPDVYYLLPRVRWD